LNIPLEVQRSQKIGDILSDSQWYHNVKIVKD